MDGLKKQLDAIVLAIVGPDLVEKWWNSPNKHWDLKTPLEVYESGLEGKMDVRAYLYLHLSGGG
jgi:hypothetical protein